MYKFLKYNKEPNFIAGRKPLIVEGRKTGWVQEEWWTKDIAVPKWWNGEYHRMVETRGIGGQKGLVKYCLRCDKRLSESGCKHNLDLNKGDDKPNNN